MRRFVLLLALSVASACSSSPSSPTIFTLQNDSFTPGGSPAFQGGFAAGEGAGAVFAARSSAYVVRKVTFLFGGGGTDQTISLALYLDDGTLPVGVPIFSNTYPITPSNAAFQEIDLTTQNIDVPAGEGLRVALIVSHSGYPGVAVDSNGLTTNRNLLYESGAWGRSETYMIAGDWIIRAEIEEG